MPETTARFAPLYIDFTFKRVFALEHHKLLLVSLIETFLGPFLQARITDIFLLPSEQINKTKKSRAAVFDLHCTDSNGNRFIIEVQISKQANFIGRLLFYIGQTITNLVKKGKKYKFDYPRIYSLSFLNYEPEPKNKNGDIVHHIGLTDIKHPQKRYNHIHIALVLLTRFKKTLEECKTTRDKWLYLFKNLHKLKRIPPRLNNNLFRTVFETAEICNFTESELRSYEANMKYLNDYNNTIEYAREEALEAGMAKGMAKGEAKGISQIAKTMKSAGEAMSKIMRYTGLSRRDIMAL